MNEFNPSTRATSSNARGHKRRTGSSKRSSFDPDEVQQAPQKKQKANGTVSDDDPATSCLPTLPGAGVFFKNQKAGSKGMRMKLQTALSSGEVLQVSDADYQLFYETTRLNDPNCEYVKKLLDQYNELNKNLMWSLLSDCNILLIGLGSKRKLVGNFVVSMLDGEDVVEIDGSGNSTGTTNYGEKYIKVLMNHISKSVLKNKGSLDSWSINLIQQATILSGTNIVYTNRNMN